MRRSGEVPIADSCTATNAPLVQPSPNGRRVGIRIVTFEACSGFTHVTAHRIAQPPQGDLCHEALALRLPGRAARQLRDQSTTLRVESSSTGDPRLRGALPISDVTPVGGPTSICYPLYSLSVHCRLLRTRHNRPRRRAAEQRDELAAPHSITSSERTCSVAGMSMPSSLAVFRLITSSNAVGCITGRSLGLSPLRMRPA